MTFEEWWSSASPGERYPANAFSAGSSSRDGEVAALEAKVDRACKMAAVTHGHNVKLKDDRDKDRVDLAALRGEMERAARLLERWYHAPALRPGDPSDLHDATVAFLSAHPATATGEGGTGEGATKAGNPRDACANCGCLRCGHHASGCEGAGGECGCPGFEEPGTDVPRSRKVHCLFRVGGYGVSFPRCTRERGHIGLHCAKPDDHPGDCGAPTAAPGQPVKPAERKGDEWRDPVVNSYIIASTSKPAPREVPVGEHVDFTPEQQEAAGYHSLAKSGLTSCLVCGAVKPAAGWRSTCKGNVKLALRDHAEHQAARSASEPPAAPLVPEPETPPWSKLPQLKCVACLHVQGRHALGEGECLDCGCPKFLPGFKNAAPPSREDIAEAVRRAKREAFEEAAAKWEDVETSGSQFGDWLRSEVFASRTAEGETPKGTP